LTQKTLHKNDELQVRYARFNNSNLNSIYPTRMVGSAFKRDDSNYKILQNLFQTPETIDNNQLSTNILNDFRTRITNDILDFNPEE
jgi:hypothetical protein